METGSNRLAPDRIFYFNVYEEQYWTSRLYHRVQGYSILRQNSAVLHVKFEIHHEKNREQKIYTFPLTVGTSVRILSACFLNSHSMFPANLSITRRPNLLWSQTTTCIHELYDKKSFEILKIWSQSPFTALWTNIKNVKPFYLRRRESHNLKHCSLITSSNRFCCKLKRSTV